MKKIYWFFSFIACLSAIFIFIHIKNKRNEYTLKCGNTEISIVYPYIPLPFAQHKANICDFPVKIIAEAQPFSKDTIFSYSFFDGNRKCKITFDDSINFKTEILPTFIEHFNITTETEVIPAYKMETDSMILPKTKNEKDLMLTTLENLTMNARTITGKAIVLDTIRHTSPFLIKTDFIKKRRISSIKKRGISRMSKFLYQECRIKLTEGDSCVNVIYKIEK